MMNCHLWDSIQAGTLSMRKSFRIGATAKASTSIHFLRTKLVMALRRSCSPSAAFPPTVELAD